MSVQHGQRNFQRAFLIERKFQRSKIKLQNNRNIKIDCNNQYKIVVEQDGYLPKTVNITTSNIYEEVVSKRVLLSPIKCYQNFSATFVDKITKQELTELKVYLISNGKTIDEINLDRFKLNFSLDCNEEFEVKIEKLHYKTAQFKFSTTTEFKKVISEIIELEPLDCKQNIDITVLDNLQKPLSGAKIQLYKNDEVLKTIESNAYNSIPVAAAKALLNVDLPLPGLPNTAIFFMLSP